MPPIRQILSAGRLIDECHASDLKELLTEKGNEGYDFVATYVSHPRCCIDIHELARKADELSKGAREFVSTRIIDELLPVFEIPDVKLTSMEWNRLVVGRISPWIDPDSDDPYIRRFSERALLRELDYFKYLSLPAILIQLRRPDNSNLARIIMEHVIDAPSCLYTIWIEIPAMAPTTTGLPNGEIAPVLNGPSTSAPDITNDLVDESKAASESIDAGDNESKTEDTWNWFFRFRRACDNHRRIQLILELTADLPDNFASELKRWKGEPLAAIKLNTRTFVSNNNGFPALSTVYQQLVKELFKMNIQCLISGPTLHHRRVADQPKQCVYFSYMNFMWKNKPEDSMEEWLAEYKDELQAPLQPLGDHLESIVYETFEKDPIKYAEYRRAFEQALITKVKEQSPSDMIVMVLGAGRGPLVQECYDVLKYSKIPFKLYAVEKNPNAIPTLNTKNESKWEKEVIVVHSDMREFHPPEKADIIVSELLGSFGDNELSPECLDGASHLMKDKCISVPQSYSAYLSPVHSPKLINEIRNSAQTQRQQNLLAAFETPYVVRVFNHYEIARPKELWRFDHPNINGNTNERYGELAFTAEEDCELMGFVGYFQATLTHGITLSTVSKRETRGLFSWFPILFPLQTQMYVKKGDTIRVAFWRCMNADKVWYEWQLKEPVPFPISNGQGRSSWMKLI